MTTHSAEQDFTDAQTHTGAKLLSIDRARRLIRYAETRGRFVHSIEAWDLLADDTSRLNLEFSMLSLGREEHEATSPQAMNDIASSILALVEARGRNVGFDVWIAPNEEFTPKSR